MTRRILGGLGFLALYGGLVAAVSCRTVPAIRTPGVAAAVTGAAICVLVIAANLTTHRRRGKP